MRELFIPTGPFNMRVENDLAAALFEIPRHGRIKLAERDGAHAHAAGVSGVQE